MGQTEVLLQKRSDRMPVMPGHLATIGGMRDQSDENCRVTTLREVEEETGLMSGILIRPSKFAEGAKCDWYVMRVSAPRFAKRASSIDECGDMAKALPWMPATASLAECRGHAWVPMKDLHLIDVHQQPIMRGLLKRVNQGVRHLSQANALATCSDGPQYRSLRSSIAFTACICGVM